MNNITIKKNEFAKKIDHTLLKPDTKIEQIEQLCNEAIVYNFASVCILPNYVSFASKLLNKSDVKVCTVIGFPLGANLLPVKLYEIEKAIESGADEVDIVVNNAYLKNKDIESYKEEINILNKTSKNLQATTKFIIETGLLTNEEKKLATSIVVDCKADFVKTSTGIISTGASLEDIELMMKICQNTNTNIKAAGGIRDLKFALDLIRAGANRLGTSSGIKILQEFDENL
jgi:deoxyribose-phosphate aldolase